MIPLPKKNFGFLPSKGLIAHCLFALVIVIIPLVFTGISLLQGQDIASTEIFLTPFRLILLAFYIKIGFFAGVTPKKHVQYSKQKVYVSKKLIPALEARYGVNILVSSSLDFFKFTHGGPTPAMQAEKALYANLVGWDEIKNVAYASKASLEDDVYLVEPIGQGSFKELSRIDDPQAERMEFHQPKTGIPSIPLGQTESILKDLVNETMHSFPPGEAVLISTSGEAADMGTVATFNVSVDEDGDIRYSVKDYRLFIESTLFNVRLFNGSLLLCTVASRDGKMYAFGKILSDKGHRNISVDKMRALRNEENGEGFSHVVFVEDIKSIHPN